MFAELKDQFTQITTKSINQDKFRYRGKLSIMRAVHYPE